MKELIFAIQFILTQELYVVDGEQYKNKIYGELAYTHTQLWLTVDGTQENFYVTHIEDHNKTAVVMFDDGDTYGTLRVGEDYVTIDFLVENEDGDMEWIKIKYKIAATNFKTHRLKRSHHEKNTSPY
jgi:hypothetical protein